MPDPSESMQRTDMGWGNDYGPFLYTLLSEPDVSSELARLSSATKIANVHCVTFQPCPNPEESNQDRYVAQDWPLADGDWKFLAVFDGHCGHELVDHAVEVLPSKVKANLTSFLDTQRDTKAAISPDRISEILRKEIAAFDDTVTNDITHLFPGGVEEISGFSDNTIRRIINDEEENSLKIVRGMRGSTALLALVNPTQSRLWVASLGDCQAVLGEKRPSGAWAASVLSSYHNAENPQEKDRIMNEHPGEQECIQDDRVLGSLAVTRALGDHVFKLPAKYTTRIFMNSKIPFQFRSKITDWIGRNRTPPYVSSVADVRHVDLQAEDGVNSKFLILCSDGLLDLFDWDVGISQVAKEWVDIVALGQEQLEVNLALRLLRDGVGGENLERVSSMMTVEMTERWMDDTTILVLPL